MRRILRFVLIVALFGGIFGLPLPQEALSAPAIDAKIEAVWPHDEQGREAPVTTAPFVNVEVYLFERGTLNPVSRSFPNRVILRWARNGPSYPAHDFTMSSYNADVSGSAVGQRVIHAIDDKTFPVWVFNDISIALPYGLEPDQKIYFFVEVEGADYRTNVWAHAANPNTEYPWQYYVPQVEGSSSPGAVDAIIQLVWPHDSRGVARHVSEASLVNIGVDLLEHHPDQFRRATVGPGFNRPVRLLRSLNGGFLEAVETADQIVKIHNGCWIPKGAPAILFPRWIFNDVDVSAARDPSNKYYFAIQVDGVPTHTTIWAHGADARTYFPQKDIPARSATD